MNLTSSTNFVLPLPPSGSFSTHRVTLVPFDASTHGLPFFTAYTSAPSLEKYLPVSFPTYPSFLKFLETVQKDERSVLFAIIDIDIDKSPLTTPESSSHTRLAGIIGLINTSASNQTTEIGPVIVLPDFQHTHITPHAIGILLRYLLDAPSQGGLGLRRVQWTAHPSNQASIKVAQKMGMQIEGVLRWMWCLPPGKEGKEPGEGRGSAKGRDSVLLSVCWDDWEEGGRVRVEELLR